MKKMGALLLSMCLLLSACSGTGDTPGKQDTADSPGASSPTPDATTSPAPEGPAAAGPFDPSEFTPWYIDSKQWMAVDWGMWSDDPKDLISDEEIGLVLKAATLPGTGNDVTNTYFVVVKGKEEQQKILGNKFCDIEDTCSDATVTVLVMQDNVLLNEEGRADPSMGNLTVGSRTSAYFNAGMTTSMLITAANSLGYYAHIWGGINGENAPFDLADGQFCSMAYYLKDDDIGYQGTITSRYGEEDQLPQERSMPVRGNYTFVCAVVLGKPAEGLDEMTFATYRARPENYTIWDGVGNKDPLPQAAAGGQEADAPETVADNQFVGVGEGLEGDVKVRITVEDGRMTAVDVIEQKETPDIGGKAVEQLPAAILKAQSADVDAVAGATVTSDAILTAVKDAMGQAGL